MHPHASGVCSYCVPGTIEVTDGRHIHNFGELSEVDLVIEYSDHRIDGAKRRSGNCLLERSCHTTR